MKFLCFIVVVFNLLQFSESLECYKCTGCRVGDTSLVENCTDSSAVCGKAYTSVAGVTLIVSKGCINPCVSLSKGDANNGGGTQCCDTDLCNSATDYKASILSITLITLLIAFGSLV